MKIALLIVLSLAGLWLLCDAIYAAYVASRIREWSATIERDQDGIQAGCQAYTVGQGSTAILLVHGINDSPYCYRKMAPALADKGFTCRVMRLPGFAEPLPRYAQATRAQWIEAVEREIRDLRRDHDHVAIVAHSLGGAITVAYLLDHPQAVDAAILLAPAIEVADHRSPLLSTRTWHEVGTHALLFTDILYSSFGNDCHDPQQRDYPGRMLFTPVEISEQTFQLLDNNRGRAEEFSTPLLMVISKLDQVIDWQAAERFYRDAGSPYKTLSVAPNSGHPIPFDNDWEDVTQQTAQFIRQVVTDPNPQNLGPPVSVDPSDAGQPSSSHFD